MILRRITFPLLCSLMLVCSQRVWGQGSFFDAKVSEYGQLEQVLGDKWNSIDSLIVHGPMDSLDFRTIVHCAKDGQVKVVNLQYATVKDNRIPNRAFYDEEQYEVRRQYLPIRRLILPDNITEFGYAAFLGLGVQQMSIPSALRKLSMSCFEDTKLTGTIVLPEGITEIPPFCFRWNLLLKKVVLPSTLKTIDYNAFYFTGLEDITLPDGLCCIGFQSFSGTKLSELVVPNTVKTIGISAFENNLKLKKLVLPEGLTSIPDHVSSGCIILEEVKIPEHVTHIGKGAFEGCLALKLNALPLRLESVDDGAFRSCPFDSIVLPATIKYVGNVAFDNLGHLKKIFSQSPEPPVCGYSINPSNNEFTFGERQEISIPLYVPVGSAEKYKAAFGWNYFTNIIETDKFPAAITTVSADHSDRYSVYGRDNLLIVENRTSDSESVPFFVYTIEGKSVARGVFTTKYTVDGLSHGIYVVRVGHEVFKVKL